MKNEIIKNRQNYLKSLNQKYNAVCFDIDGTLTEEGTNHIDLRVIPHIAKLIKDRVPVVFITGRGETGLQDLKRELIDELLSKYNITPKMLTRVYALTNDGCRLFNTTSEFVPFGEGNYVINSKELTELSELNDELFTSFKNSKNILEYIKVSHSINSKDGKILNIRIIVKNNNTEILNEILYNIKRCLKNERYYHLNVTRGIFKNDTVIQIGAAKKSDAIRKTESIIGIPENSMLRIGDCGDENGNDYSMLDCSQGFSVNKISIKEDACFPIFDNDGNIIKGVSATIYLLQKAKILPTICLETADREKYRKNYAVIEGKIQFELKKQMTKFNYVFNNNFSQIDNVYDVFDEETGSIKIPMFELERIDDDNSLKRFWLSGEDDKLFYSLRSDNEYLLRGSRTYYHFLSTRDSIYDENKSKYVDFTTGDVVEKWYENYYSFFMNANVAIFNTKDINNISNKKMILGILDNARNYLLTSINYQIMKNYYNKNVLINLEAIEELLLKRQYIALKQVLSEMKRICFDRKQIRKDEIIKINQGVTSLVKYEEENFIKIDNLDYSKQFRAFREIDNFAQNYITVSSSVDIEKNEIGLCGLCYGGIELPILYKVINNNITDISLLNFNNNASGYKKKQSVKLRFFNIEDYGGIDIVGIDKNKKYILLDDNLMTGKTMQLAINCMYDLGIKIDNLIVVRYPGINRLDQMFMDGHSAVDYKFFFDFIKGLYFRCPYTWNDLRGKTYEDSLGTFDKGREKVLEYLIKNHDFSVNSEVNKLKRRIKNENS